MPGNSRLTIQTTLWFDKSLEKLDHGLQARIVAQLGKFKEAWASNLPWDQLTARYEYKSIERKGSDSHLNVKQIRLTKDTRVHLTIVEEAGVTYLIEVFQKTSVAVQNAAIERSCRRAQTMRETVRGRQDPRS